MPLRIDSDCFSFVRLRQQTFHAARNVLNERPRISKRKLDRELQEHLALFFLEAASWFFLREQVCVVLQQRRHRTARFRVDLAGNQSLNDREFGGLERLKVLNAPDHFLDLGDFQRLVYHLLTKHDIAFALDEHVLFSFEVVLFLLRVRVVLDAEPARHDHLR